MNPLIIIFLLPLILAFSPVATPTEKGIDAFSAGKYDDALSQFGNAAKDNPDKAEAHINLGDALYRKGEFDKAAKEYSEAARLKPNMPEAWYNMGDALYKMGAYDKALSAFQKADSLKKEADTKHNIEVTMEKVKKEQAKKNGGGPQEKSGGQGKQGSQRNQGKQESQGRQGKPGPGAGSQNQPGLAGGLSEGDVSRMLSKQGEEEKSLRSYFRPGKRDPLSEREAQIEQMLRGMGGAPAPSVRAVKPGAPYVEKDW